MAKKEKNYVKKKKSSPKREFIEEKKSKLKTETKHGIWAIVFFVLALFLFMSLFHIGGKAGEYIYNFFDYLFGYGYILLPLLFILLGWSFLKSVQPKIGLTRAISSVLFLLSSLGIIDIISGGNSGGFLGKILSTPFKYLFDVYASGVFLVAILIISILIMFDTKPAPLSFLRRIKNIFIRKTEIGRAHV